MHAGKERINMSKMITMNCDCGCTENLTASGSEPNESIPKECGWLVLSQPEPSPNKKDFRLEQARYFKSLECLKRWARWATDKK